MAGRREHMFEMLSNDGGSWDELSHGNTWFEVSCSAPGDLFAMDTDLMLYWPKVRECWEEDVA